MRKTSIIVMTLLIIALATPSFTAFSTTSIQYKHPILRITTYVSPILYTEEFWEYGAYVEDAARLVFTSPTEHGEPFMVVNSNTRLARIIVILDRSIKLDVIRGKIRGLLGVFPTHLYNIVVALATYSDVDRLATTPGVIALLPDIRLDPVFIKQGEVLSQLEGVYGYDQMLGTGSSEGDSYHYTVNITRAIDVWLEYGIRGEETTIAIIDTGVDYGSPALGLEALARDEYGLPLVFDASSLGLVLTPVEARVEDGYIVIDPEKLYVFYQPYYVFKWSQGLWVAVSGCRSYSTYVSWPTGNRWYIGDMSVNGPVKFGLMMYYATMSVGGTSSTIRFTAPVITIDSDGDGFYDTVYVDTTTSLYLLNLALAPPPCSVTIPGAPTVPDYSFADEKPIRYGSEIVARDLNGDGIYDFSIGTLAGYVYDSAYAIIFDYMGIWREYVTPLPHGHGHLTYFALLLEIWSYEPVALIWPGLDPYGSYVVLQYDYHSHGTLCATTAAGRDYYAETGYGVRSIAGQAPKARIAASPALYFGTVVTSIYFFTGFDLATPYGFGSRYLWPLLQVNPWIAFEGWSWEFMYTGRPRVDITSNSYGISGWVLWGWASGMDPESAVFDYTTMTSGVPHFIAVGNGGPGWGTIASPASSTLSIGVGAATEFTYRPFYGYSWPGSSRQVISWSNRGPTELGIVKPDVVAVGSFAWAIGRTWEALDHRTVDGRYLRRLFSGTSQATPMAAGVGALVVSAYKGMAGRAMPAHLLKTVLMNTAYDMGFDELSQGAGFVDAYRAVTAVLDPTIPKVYSTTLLQDLLSELRNTYSTVTYGYELRGVWYEPKIYIPVVEEGGSATRTLTIEGPGRFRVYPIRLVQTDVRNLCDLVTANLNPTIITSCVGEDIAFSVTAATLYGHLVLDPSLLLSADFFEIELTFPFERFETGGRTGAFNVVIPTTILELAYWIDTNRDGMFSWFETARIYYDIRRANYVRIQIGNLARQIEEIEYLATKVMGRNIEDMTKAIVVRIGVSGATYRGILPIKARLIRYSTAIWRDVTVSPSTMVSRGRATVAVTVTGMRPGFYSGYIVVEETTRGLKYLIPISYFVPIDLTLYRPTYRLTPRTEKTMYRNTYLRGAFDYTWRYESGDWRVFKVYVPSATRMLGVRVTWPTHDRPTYASNLDVMVFGPWTYYMVDEETMRVLSYRVDGIQLAAELSRDPMGGGGYNPTRFWDSIGAGTSLILSPTPSAGVYRIVVRNIQFSGMLYEEPFTLELLPVYAYVSVPRYINLARGTRGWITIYRPTELWPIAILPPEDCVWKPVRIPDMYYIESLSDFGITIVLREPEIRSTYYRIKVEVTTSPTAYNGFYIVAFNYRAPVPVTTIGWIDRGEPTVFFEWYSLPIYFTFTATEGLSQTVFP